MADQSGDSQLEFPIDQQLLEESTQAREEWRVIKDRLAKIEQTKAQVSVVVYERVHRDYDTKLKEATAELMRKKEAMDREMASLRQTRKKISSQLENHHHKLEEIKFRNTLGEFSEEEYQASAKVEQDKITKFETVLNAVDSNISRYEAVFAEEDEAFGAGEEAGREAKLAESGEISAFTPVGHEAEPVTDAKGFVIEEEEGPDYFQATASGVRGAKGVKGSEESTTAKPAPKKRAARVVLVSGDSAGDTYEITGTATFGRAESNTVPLKDAKVSRQHAQIQQQGNGYVLVDLNSSNGTFVNGQRIEEHVLSNGDEITIGDFIFQFQI